MKLIFIFIKYRQFCYFFRFFLSIFTNINRNKIHRKNIKIIFKWNYAINSRVLCKVKFLFFFRCFVRAREWHRERFPAVCVARIFFIIFHSNWSTSNILHYIFLRVFRAENCKSLWRTFFLVFQTLFTILSRFQQFFFHPRDHRKTIICLKFFL